MSNKYQIENMKCDGCVSAVKTALEQLDGVEEVSIDLESKTVDVTGEVDSSLIEKTLSDAGYPAILIN